MDLEKIARTYVGLLDNRRLRNSNSTDLPTPITTMLLDGFSIYRCHYARDDVSNMGDTFCTPLRAISRKMRLSPVRSTFMARDGARLVLRNILHLYIYTCIDIHRFIVPISTCQISEISFECDLLMSIFL